MKATQLKNAVLQLAIQGKLVPQDPNDEPASLLLEKIQAEKEKLIAQGKIKKSQKTSNKPPYPIQQAVSFEIPESWVYCKLNQLGEIIGGGTPKTDCYDNWQNGDIAWVTPADMKSIKGKYIKNGSRNITLKGLNSSSAKILAPKSIIYSSRAPIGYIAITQNELCTNQGFKSVQLYITALVDYLYYVLIAITPEIQSRASGTTFKEISGNEFGNTVIPLPPLAEQIRIVKKLEELLPYIEQYGEKEEQLSALNQQFPERLKKSILQAAIQGKLTTQLNSDEPAIVLIKKIQAEKEGLIAEKKIKKPKQQSEIYLRDNLPYEKINGIERCIANEVPFAIPENWSWIRLGEIAQLIIGKTPARNENIFWDRALIPWVSISDMEDGKYIFATEEYINAYSLKHIFKNKLIPKGTLLMSFKLTVGKVSILGMDAVHNEAIISIVPYMDSPQKSIRDYLFNILSLISKSGISKKAIKGYTLNSQSLFDLLIPLPPIKEQSRFLEKIAKLLDYVNKL